MNPWHQFINDLAGLSDKWVAQGRGEPKTAAEALIQRTRAECGLEFTTILTQGLTRIQDAEPPSDTSRWALEDAGYIDHIDARVHAAWMAEKQRQGYADHAYVSQIRGVAFTGLGQFEPEIVQCCEKPESQHHTDMLPYDQLAEAVKEYDRATVRAVLAALIEEDTP